MIKALIVDDEQHCIDRLRHLVTSYCYNEVVVQAATNNITEAVELIQNIQPDLVFLDIQIGKDSGFDLIKSFNPVNFDVIFVTGYEKYALQAFRFSAVDYLLKPVDPDELVRSIAKFKNNLHNKDAAQKYELLFYNLKTHLQPHPKIAIPSQHGLDYLPIQDIVRCQSNINYTIIYSKNKSTILVAKTLKEFETILVHHNFYRIHNSHLVNLSYIKSYNKGKGGYVILEDLTEIEVSVRRKEGLLQKMMSL